MKAFIIVLLVAALLAGGGYLLKQRSGRQAAEAAAAAEAQVLAEREAMFGPEALSPDIIWRSSGLGVLTVREGTGVQPFAGAEVRFHYIGRLKDGTVFDQSKEPMNGRIGRLVPGMSAGLQMMREGGRAVFFIPPSLGYGKVQIGVIPENSSLIFEVELLPR